MFPGNVNFQKTDTKHDLDIRDVVPCLLLKMALLKYRNSNSKNFKHSIKNKYGNKTNNAMTYNVNSENQGCGFTTEQIFQISDEILKENILKGNIKE